jgi:ABC-2 type transport system ATP-binding protein
LTVLQNLEFFAALHGLSRRQCRAKSEGPLAELGLEKHRDTRFSELSSGMKQSLALVRSLLHDPPVLLLDEPTRSLSPDLALRAQALLRGLARQEGRSILLATHNLGEAEALADQVAILHGGRIVAQGEPSDLAEGQGLPEAGRMEALFRRFTRTAPEVEL